MKQFMREEDGEIARIFRDRQDRFMKQGSGIDAKSAPAKSIRLLNDPLGNPCELGEVLRRALAGKKIESRSHGSPRRRRDFGRGHGTVNSISSDRPLAPHGSRRQDASVPIYPKDRRK